MTQHDLVLILDFGSQVTQLIARRVREAGVYSEIHPFTLPLEKIKAKNPKAIILSGGPASVHEMGSPTVPTALFDLGVPVLGICYGQQLMAQLLGGTVTPGTTREFGRAQIKTTRVCDLFPDVWTHPSNPTVWMSHGDKVTHLPEGFETFASSEGAPHAIMADAKRKFYGVQFHPEVTHTPHGDALLRNFVLNIAGLKPTWDMPHYIDEKAAAIKTLVGNDHVICGLSGGVDSAVAAILIHKAIGDQLTCILVDTGLLRANEAEQVATLFREHYHVKLHVIDAKEKFLGALSGVSDPEVKRKTIGRLFIEVFDEEAKKIKDAKWLAQGTLYPDVIESVSATGGPSATIKSHHNVGGLPERMNLKLLEPLRELFKDEVRQLGRALGLPDAFIKRHPFPGPGLAIRIPGEISSEKVALLQKADAIYLEELHKANLYDEIWQAFAVLLPVKTVGVMGDGRTYDYVLALRAVTATDGMTADSYPFEHSFLSKVATRLINDVKGINRVVYDVTSKPPGTIEWE